MLDTEVLTITLHIITLLGLWYNTGKYLHTQCTILLVSTSGGGGGPR